MRTSAIFFVAAVSLVSTTFAVIAWFAPGREHIRELSGLRDAFARERPFEPRLSGGFPHAPVRGALRSSGLGPPQIGETDSAIVSIREAVRRDGTIAARRAGAAADLATGLHDSAVEALKGLVLEDHEDAASWNDLAVALLVRSRPDDAAGALTAATRALRQRPGMAEALFNKALALEQLGLVYAARKSWQAYLARTPASGWDDEVHHRARRLDLIASADEWHRARTQIEGGSRLSQEQTRAIVMAFPQETREWIAEEGLPAWAAAHLSGNARAGDILNSITDLAVALERRGDSLAADAARAIATARGDTRLALARGHHAYGQAHRASISYRHAEARTLFEDAIRELGARSPFVLWARFGLAAASFRNGSLEEAETALRRLRDAASAQGYTALTGRVEWIQGLIDGNRGDTASEGRAFRASLAAFETLRETENAAVVRSLMAESAELIGDRHEAWKQLSSALPVLPRMRQATRQLAVLFIAADTAMNDGHPEAALPFYDEFLRISEQMNSDEAIAEAYLHRARAYLSLGQTGEASGDLEGARRALSAAGPTGSAAFLAAQLRAMDADSLAHSDPAAARVSIDQSIAYFTHTGRTAWLTRGYLTRARLALRAGRLQEAESDLRRGIQLFESHHSAIDTANQRVSYQENRWELFQEIVDLMVRQARYPEAFAFAERGRGLERPTAAVAFELSALRGAIPAHAAVVYYAQTAGGIVAWGLTATTQEVVRVPAEDLGGNVERFRSALQRGDMTSASRAGATLTEVLITPLRATLTTARRIVFIPDGALHQLPFAALPDGQTGEPLLRSHVVAVSPSAKAFLQRASRLSAALRGKEPSVFVAANPTRGSTAAAALPASELEARDLEALYPNAQVVVGSAATRDAVLGHLGSSTIVHLGSHAIANSEFPELSRFLFAPERGAAEMSVVLARDLERLKYRDTQLVVLAACDTASGRITRSEGVLSLARPFLAAGVPSVVATLWPIDDRSARALFTALHREYRDGLDAAAALRAAQLHVLDNPAFPPGAWAAPVVFGGTPQP